MTTMTTSASASRSPSQMTTRPHIRALLLDLSGTLHIESSPTPGAVVALSRLRAHNSLKRSSEPIPFRFCSNTSKEGSGELEERLRWMGFDIREFETVKGAELWTSVGAVKSLLIKRGLARPLCLLEKSAEEEIMDGLRSAGLPSDSDAGRDYDSVVVGLSPSHFTYEHLNTAFRILISNPEIPLIATHRAKYIRTSKNNTADNNDVNSSLSLGPGPFVAALENASGAHAEVVGKPTRMFFETVIDSFESDELGHEGKIAIIGDDVENDLGGEAVDLGLWRVLVRTGKYRPGDEHRPGIIPPDEVYESFAAFVDSLLPDA